MVVPLDDRENLINMKVEAVVERSINSNSRQLLGCYVTPDGLYDIHLTATLQGAAPMAPGPYPKDISQCKGCEADIVWVKTKAGKNMPVNVLPTEPDFRAPRPGELKFVYGEHESHFQTCPCAGEFRHG